MTEKEKEYHRKYRLEHFNETKESKRKWRLANPEYQRKWRLTHLESVKESWNKWCLAHPEYSKENNKKYRLTHKGCDKEYRLTHKKNIKEGNKKWKLLHPKQVKELHKKFLQTPKGKSLIKRGNAKRRQFGFIPLNNCSNGVVGHHIDKERVIYIPTEMHIGNHHSVIKDFNMDVINTLAFNWLEAEELYANIN